MMTWDPVWCQSNRHGTTFLPCKEISDKKNSVGSFHTHLVSICLSWSPLCKCLSHAARWRHTWGSLMQTRTHTVNDDLLSTYRIFFPPQMCSLGAALLREEGVKVGGFPLTAAPVFHPGDAGKTYTRWNFSNHGMSLKRPENNTNRKN